MKPFRPLAVGAAALGLVASLVPAPAVAQNVPVLDVAAAQVFLRSQQQADGGFEVAGSAGFETPDAVFAIAGAAQTGSGWDTAKARNAVESAQSGGANGLDYLDHLVDADVAAKPATVAGAARAAKVIALVAAPLGISATDFDPSDDSATPVDLVALMNAFRQADGTYDFDAQFNGVLYATIALASLGQPVPAPLIAQIGAAQRGNGSWDFSGENGPDGDDVDTTSVALLALARAGVAPSDPVVSSGLAYLARRHQPSGAWQAFGADDPNATATAAVAVSAFEIDPTTTAWVTRFAPELKLSSYRSPYAYLAAQQASDGHVRNASEADFGVNTFATSQAVQAVTRQWHQAPAHLAFTTKLAQALGSPAALPSAAAAGVASGALGGNVAVASARTRAAQAVLASSFGREAAADDLFRRVFDRPIDTSGRTYWSGKLVTISRPEMLSRLTGSAEFYRLAGSTTSTFVDDAYEASLGRLPDPGGKAYWVRVIDRGGSREAVARSLVVSNEARGREVDQAYQRLFGRAPDAAGRTYWTKALLSTRIEVLLKGMAGSQEFLNRATA